MQDFLSIFEKVLLFLALVVALYHFGTALQHKIMLLLLGKNEDRFKDFKKSVILFRDYVLLQKRVFKDPIYGAMHAVFFWGFLAITIETFNFIAQGFYQRFHLPFTGNPFFLGFIETVEVLVLIGLVMAFHRRLVKKPNNLSLNSDGLYINLFYQNILTNFHLKAEYPQHLH